MTELAWCCMEECAESFHQALLPCAMLTTLAATLHAAPQVKYLTSPGDHGGLVPELLPVKEA